MKRIDISRKLSEKSTLSQKELLSFIDHVFKTIEQALIQGKRVEIRRFGTFDTKQKNQISIYHPQTGKKITIKSHRVPRFHTSPILIGKISEKQSCV